MRSVDVVAVSDGDGGYDYEPQVRYRYRAMGAIRDGDRLRVGAHARFRDKLAAELALKGYRPGERVTVYFDPVRPERSVLETVPSPTGIAQWLIFGGFLIAAATYCFVTITWPSPFKSCDPGHDCPRDING